MSAVADVRYSREQLALMLAQLSNARHKQLPRDTAPRSDSQGSVIFPDTQRQTNSDTHLGI